MATEIHLGAVLPSRAYTSHHMSTDMGHGTDKNKQSIAIQT